MHHNVNHNEIYCPMTKSWFIKVLMKALNFKFIHYIEIYCNLVNICIAFHHTHPRTTPARSLRLGRKKIAATSHINKHNLVSTECSSFDIRMFQTFNFYQGMRYSSLSVYHILQDKKNVILLSSIYIGRLICTSKIKS